MLNVGDSAPDFEVTAHDGSTVRSTDFQGQKIVLWFYPVADTPGWTIEGKGFRDGIRDFEDAGAVILGISADDVEANRKFAEKYDFPFKLLADTSRETCVAYGALDDTSGAGYPRRLTYVIEGGKITHAYKVTDVKSHPGQVLADISS